MALYFTTIDQRVYEKFTELSKSAFFPQLCTPVKLSDVDFTIFKSL